jgi:hypothetical protein
MKRRIYCQQCAIIAVKHLWLLLLLVEIYSLNEIGVFFVVERHEWG